MTKPELRVVIGLHRAVNKLDRMTGRLLKPYDLTIGQFAVLEALYHKGAMTVGEVKERILSSSGTIPLIIGNLEKRGLLIRSQDDADRRRFILCITDEGKRLMEEVYPLNEAMITEELAIYDKGELLKLSELLKRYGGQQ